MDNIRVGEAISIRHYSGINPFKSIVLALSQDTLMVKLTKDFAVMNFFEGDPVVFGYELGDEVRIFGCNIEKIVPKDDIVILKVDSVEAGANQRKSERYPVSLYADIRMRDSKKKHLATIKDMSYYGMLIYTKADLRLNEPLEVDIFMDKTMVFLKTNIVRKGETAKYFQYGLGIVYEDSNSLNFMKEYLKRLRTEQEQAIRKIKHL